MTISWTFRSIFLGGKVEVEYSVRTSFRSLYLEGGQIRKARAQRGLSGWLVGWFVGWVGAWCVGRWGGFSCVDCACFLVGDEVFGDKKDLGTFRAASSPSNECELFCWEREEGF